MVAPTLNIHEYQFGDSGVKLNSSASLPFVDIQKIKGLDMPTIEVRDTDVDGVHGGEVYARFFSTRTIVLEGMAYAPVGTTDTYINNLISNFLPISYDESFYFRLAGPSQMYCLAKPVGFNCDIDLLRNTGSAKIQIQLKCADPRKYINNANQAVTSGTTYTAANAGNINSYPTFQLTGIWTALTLLNVTTGQSVVLANTGMAAGNVTVIDMQKRIVTINGIRRSGLITAADWWSIDPGGNQYRVTRTGAATITAITAQAWA